MNVYVESNFVLELALLQEQWTSCEAILTLCEAKSVQLVVPGLFPGRASRNPLETSEAAQEAEERV